MNHVVTVKDIVLPVLALGGVAIFFGIIFFAIYMLNPFRSGH